MKRACTTLAFVLGALSVTATPVIALVPNTGFTTNANVSQPIGWTFYLSTNFTVNQLGWYDQGGDGLGEGHQIAIWDTSQNLIAGASVPSGTAAILDGGFRMVSIPNTILGPGQYVIGGLTGPSAGDLLYFDVTEVVNPAVSWVSDNFSGVSGTAGTSSPTPEPASFGLVGASLLDALLLRRAIKS